MARQALGVKFNPASGGTGDWVASTTATGYAGVSNLVNGQTYRYRAENSALTEWEWGTGVWNSSTSTLTRATVTLSSTGSKVSFTAPPQVGIVIFPDDLLQFDTTQSLTTAQKAQAKDNLGLALAGKQVFTTTGAGTYTPTSADVRWIRIRMVGGGGGGANATAAASQTNLGSAGAGGGYVEHIMAAGSYSFVVGAGGAAQTNGADTTFNSGALVSSGGSGTSFTAGSGTTVGRASGTSTGGAASGGNVANIPGENGDVAFRYGGSDGICARGGKSFLSGQSGQTLVGGAAADGKAGKSYGGGGGGAGSGSAGAATGGAGADGVIIVEEYY